MADNINWTVSIQVPGGPKTSLSHTISIEAYDSIRVNIPKKKGSAVTQEVKIQPDTDKEKVNFLAIMSDQYDDKLTFKVNNKADSTASITLNQPLIFAGTESVGLLDPSAAPGTLFFSNDTDKTFQIWVIVGRNIIKK